MKEQKLLDYFFLRAKDNTIIEKSHVTLFLAIYYCWLRNEHQNPINITRKGLMDVAKIKAISTYHRCIKDLDKLGFLKYKPSYNPTGSFIHLPTDLLD